MPRHSKRYLAAAEANRSNGALAPDQAVARVKKLASAKFDETVEAAVRLGVDPRRADQVVRGTVILPAGTGKTMKVLVFAVGAKAAEAEEAGADFVGMDYVSRIQDDGWLDFDVAIATPDQMKNVARLGRVLGPRGLMPNPKTGTVTMEVGQAVREAKAGKIDFRVDRTGNVHVPIGKVSFDADKLSDNLVAFMDEVVRLKPSASKGRYVRSLTVASTMGPGVAVNTDLYR